MNYFKNSIWAICLLFSLSCWGQKHEETINREVVFNNQSNDNQLIINNIFGSISVEAYEGKKILIEVQKHIRSKNQNGTEIGKKEVVFETVKRDGKIHLFTNTPYSSYDVDNGLYKHDWKTNERKYEYWMDYKVQVPKNTNLKLTTINDGEIYVKGVEANLLEINNVNGGIDMEKVAGKTFVNALNEDINVEYVTIPVAGSEFKSLNGDVNVTIHADLNADVYFKSLNGDFYTNIDKIDTNVKSTYEKKKGRKGTKYEVNAKSRFQLGDGGDLLSFDLLNGDVLLRKN